MSASYPSSAKTFSAVADGDTVAASLFNAPNDEITAIEADLLSFAHAFIPDGDYTRFLGDATHRWAHTSLFKEVTITSTGTLSNYDPSYLGCLHLRCNNATALTITGRVAAASGCLLLISAANAQVNLTHDATSTAANRLYNKATSGATPLAAGGHALYIYDATLSRWVLKEHEQGAWITPTFAAGDYTASSGNWTVGSGDVTLCKYKLIGRTLHWCLNLATTTVSSTPASLKRAIPGGYTGVADFRGSTAYWDNATTAGTGIFVSTTTTLDFYRDITGTLAYSAATDQTYVQAQGALEVT